MIGNVIQSQFLELINYPAAAALSFILMALILVGAPRATRGSSGRRSSPDEAAEIRPPCADRYAILAFVYLLVRSSS